VAARLLGLLFRIPPGALISACCECCVLLGRGLCDGPIPRPEDRYPVCCCESSGAKITLYVRGLQPLVAQGPHFNGRKIHSFTLYKVQFAYYCRTCSLIFPYINTHRMVLFYLINLFKVCVFLLFTYSPHTANIPYYSLAVFTTTLAEISYIKTNFFLNFSTNVKIFKNGFYLTFIHLN
jgi:hypothetical protein